MKNTACVLAMIMIGLVGIHADEPKVVSTLLINGQKKTYDEWTVPLTKGLTLEEVKEFAGEPSFRSQEGEVASWYYSAALIETNVPTNVMDSGFDVRFEGGILKSVSRSFMSVPGAQRDAIDRRDLPYRNLVIIPPVYDELPDDISKFIEDHYVKNTKLNEKGLGEAMHFIAQYQAVHLAFHQDKVLTISGDCQFAQLVKSNLPQHKEWMDADGKMNLTKAADSIMKEWEKSYKAEKAVKPIPVKVSVFELRLVLKDGTEGEGVIKKKSADGEELTLAKAEDFGNDDIKSASVEVQPSLDWSVMLKMTEEGAKKFGELTEKAVGERLAILLDGKLVSAPTINEPIRGGSVQISGVSEKEARDLVDSIMGRE